jgi:hypothetical protein
VRVRRERWKKYALASHQIRFWAAAQARTLDAARGFSACVLPSLCFGASFLNTYPLRSSDGSLHAFEIGNAFISMGAIRRILRSVDGVTSIERQFRSDDRLTFRFNGVPCVVYEPWGDNSRYLIGPREAKDHGFDVAPIHDAFARYQSPLVRLWMRIRNVGV